MQERIWLKNYPKSVPHDITVEGHNSLVQLIDEVLIKFKDRPAYYNMGKTMTFAQVDEQSAALAAYLQGIGLQPGDKIALMMPNILSYPVALFGALRAGLVIVNTNPLYTAREMEHQFNDSGAKAIIIAENFAAEFQKVMSKTPIKHVLLTSIGEMMGLKGFIVDFVVRKVKKMVPAYQLPGATWLTKAIKSAKGKTYKKHSSNLEDVICLQYTGGTTGVSKGAMLTNSNLLHNMYQVKAWIGSSNLVEGKEVMLTPLPLYHVFSFTVNCLCMSSFGALNVLITNPRDIPALVKEIKKTRPSLMTGVNTLFNALLNNADFCKLDFSPLKLIVGGAMAIQRPVAEKWKQITGRPLVEGFGMTETSPCACVNPLNNDERIGTIGLPLSSTYIRIADPDTNTALPLGEVGEIQVYGPQVMKGYYQKPEETAKVIVDGWMKTGDMGLMDNDGFVKIVDRLKDMILVSGFNVYPNEIEEVIASHPKVLEVAAIGIPDEKSGEVPKVFIVKKDPSLTEEEVLKHCNDNLTGYKRPRYVEFRTELPKTNVGKILRRALRS